MVRRLVPAAALVALLAVPIGTAAAQERTCTPGSRVPAPEELRPQADLRCVDLAGADLRGMDFGQADLSGADLSGADLTNASLVQAELVGADLTGAKLDGAELNQADLSQVQAAGVDFSGLSMIQVDLVDADLSGADLSDVNASQAEARNVDLSDADISGADFTQADLSDADLSGANASGATFTQADVDGVDTDGLQGRTNYANLLLYGAFGLFVLLAALSVRKALQPERPNRYAGAFASMPPMFSTTVPPPPAPAPGSGSVATMAPPQPPVAVDPLAPQRSAVAFKLATGLIGSAMVVLGLHLAIGGGIGTFIGMLDPLSAGCDGPQCKVGVDAGAAGMTIGVFVTIFGFAVRQRNPEIALDAVL